MKKIRVERIHQTKGSAAATMSAPEFMLFAERVEAIFQQQIENRASAPQSKADEFEVITEWL